MPDVSGAPRTEPLDSGNGCLGSRMAFGWSTQELIFWLMNVSLLASWSWGPEAVQVAFGACLNRHSFDFAPDLP